MNGYLGTDGIDPLLKVGAAQDKGIFVLVKTSNKSSGELQNLPLEGGETIYGRMACMCDEWGRELPGDYGFTGLGAVVNSSRAIMCAYKKEGCDETDFAGAARREALRMRDDINGVLR